MGGRGLGGYEFAVDSMLGKVARMLRILGYSTFYDPDVPDDELLEVACEHSATLVTRDRVLYMRALRRGVRAVFVSDPDVVEALRTLHSVEGIRLAVDLDRTRCPLCNHRLRRASPGEVEGRVPPPVLRGHSTFLVCDSCGKVYWPGRHLKSIRATLALAGCSGHEEA